MSHTKKIKIFFTIIALLMCFTMLFTLAACNNIIDNDDDTNADETEAPKLTELTTNGSFYNASGDTFPKAPSSWTGSQGHASGDNATPNTADDLTHGVINTSAAIYNANASKWGNLANPGNKSSENIGEDIHLDSNVLMIYNKNLTAYKYANTATTLAIGGYYRLTVWVKTVDIQGDDDNPDYGAYIYFSNGIVANFKAIDTQGEWVPYSVYIESSHISTTTITTTISLGYGSTIDGMLTTGYAFFDSVNAVSISYNDFLEADESQDNVAKYSKVFENGNFNYYTGTSSPYTPNNFTTLNGTGNGGTAYYTTSYALRGVVDLKNDKEASAIKAKNITVPNPYESELDESFALMLHNTNYISTGTSTGYKSSNFMAPIGKVIKISMWVYTDIKNTNASELGVTVKIKGNTELVSPLINTNKTWQEVVFYVKGSDTTNYTYNMELWLGQGGRDDTSTHVYGSAFFDNISITSYNSTEFNWAEIDDAYKTQSASTPNLILNGNFNQGDGGIEGWSFAPYKDVVVGQNDVEVRTLSKTQLDDATYMEGLGLHDELKPISYPADIFAPVLMIHNKVPTAYTMQYDSQDSLIVKKNSYVKLTVWIKTKDLSGSNASLKISSLDDEGEKTTLAAFDSINTESYVNKMTNNYIEYVIYIEGSGKEDTEIAIDLTLGTGSNIDPSGYASGYLFIANIAFSSADYDGYTNYASTNYSAKKSLIATEANETIPNGKFNTFDRSSTEFDPVTGELVEAATPARFTATGADLSNANYGILDATNQDLLDKYDIDGSMVYNAWNDNNSTVHPVNNYIVTGGSPNFLFIQSKPDDMDESTSYNGKLGNVVGYKTDSLNLNASTYYLIFAEVKTVAGKASLYLTPSTNINTLSFTDIDTDNKWEIYVFAVEVGMASTNVTMTLNLGASDTATNISGEVYFDNLHFVSFTSYEDYVTEKAKYTDNSNVNFTNYSETSMIIDGFDRITGATPIDRPYTSNWTGTIAADNSNNRAPNGTDNQLIGVINVGSELSDTGIVENGSVKDGTSIVERDVLDSIFEDSAMAPFGLNVGENLLMINNKVASGYSYKTYSSKTLTNNKYYEASVWVKTYLIEENKGAYIRLHTDEVTYTYFNINTASNAETMGEWTKYSFYLFNDSGASVYSVYVTIGLGLYNSIDDKDEYVQGYAFFDNFTIREMTSSEYDTKATAIPEKQPNEDGIRPKRISDDGNEWVLVMTKLESDEADPIDPDPSDPLPPAGNNFEWLYISSMVIGGVLIIVVVVVLIRHIRKKPKIKVGKADYDKTKAKRDSKKRSEYDNYKD